MKQKLNIFNIPLHGINLIEASAGTGKTSSIILMYLRLLLGIGDQKNNKKLTIKEILIVTFTNAAKEEIYTRIKKHIEELYLYFITKKTNNLILKPFLGRIKNLKEAVYTLEKAQKNIKNISIYTIHGFCKDILQLNFIDIHEKIIENENFLYLQAIQDFWRDTFYNLPKKIIYIISQYYKNPESLLIELQPVFNFKKIYFDKKFNKNDNILKCHKNNINIINIFKKKWLNYNLYIFNIIQTLKINKKIYNQYNISRWINNITIWAKSKTENYEIPDFLKYFSQEKISKNIKNESIPFHFFFNDIDNILKKNFSLKDIILFQAIKKVPQFLKKEKKKKSLLGFNDLLNILLKYIKKEKKLRQLIINKYPVAFIDEFQDTDIQQYQIFNLLYNINIKKTALFLIGDPKQSIYSFRGADIFSYLYAKSTIKNYYYLNTNWRSSKEICQAINYLFSSNKKPFFFKNISYTNIHFPMKNKNMKFKIKGKVQNSINLFFKKQENINLIDYQEWISKQCANEISYWLIYAKKGEATLIDKKNQERVLQPSDIVVLVRNKNEANIIKEALKKLNIKSIYSSSNENIFHTNDAQELLIILESILDPNNINLLKQSIFTHIFYQILLQEDKKNNIEKSYFLIKKLYKYRDIWENIGIYYTIKKIILDFQKYSNHLDKCKNYQKNINFLHIAELLEKKSQIFYQKSSLLKWFERQILEKQNILKNENIRKFKQSNIIQIITIHKSKGLEYPIVWIPFASIYKESKSYLYHNQKNFKIFYDLEHKKTTQKISEEERLSEDLRFLYVAITRSIYHCSLGIGHILYKKTQKKSNIHKSSLGYIIQRGYNIKYKDLINELNQLNQKKYIKIKYDSINIKLPYIKEEIYLLSKPINLKNSIKTYFQITSFTELKKTTLSYYNQNYYDIKNILNQEILNTNKIEDNNFPKGKKTGILIHHILKKIDFSKKLNHNFFYKTLKKYDFSEQLAPSLISWVHNIINIKIKNINLNLSMLKKNQYIKEMKFFLPIKNILNSTDFNNIIQSFDPISSISPKISFDPFLGIIKGAIDLILTYNEKYYIIDYKSNYLGNNKNSYSSENIKKEIIKNRYDLQYQIYTIALHQFLKKKVNGYKYKKHFGGIFYIFLRGLNKSKKNQSVFYTVPKYILIKKLINLFSIKKLKIE
ncbi:RecBCD enzyme subunit RecB [Buchnera aphidicola (Protaphis terricola)]|uniref:exodeoxyribonuclease V subunit beta n=1 Tax=Buchnera aphidicola TaxID=9 RepID=UPI0034646A07